MGKKIVFVLGAGASVPYGHPTGPRLVELIWSKYPQIASRLREGAGPAACASPETVRDFADTLRRSGRQSIDIFLEHCPRFAQLGKEAIAASLLDLEVGGDSAILTTPASEDWIRWLVNSVTDSSPEGWTDRLAFITYNYDRVLEHHVYTRIHDCFEHLTKPAAADLVRQAQIVHLHGTLGYLPWEKNPESSLAFGAYAMRGEKPAMQVWNARQRMGQESAAGIRIIHEQDPQTPGFQRARELLSDAKLVVFLGFGYARANLSRLALAQALPENTPLVGTAFGMTSAEQLTAKRRIVKLAGGKVSDAHVELMEADCLTFMRNSERLLKELEKMEG